MKARKFKQKDLKFFTFMLKKNEVLLKRLYKELFSSIRAQVSLDTFRKVIASGDVKKVASFFADSVGFDLFQNKLQSSLGSIGLSFGSLQSKLLKKVLNVDFSVQQVAQPFKKKFGTIVAEHSVRLTKNLKEDAVKIVISKIKSGRAANLTVGSIAKNIKEHIPLSERQSIALDNFKGRIISRGERAKEVLKNQYATKSQLEIAKKDISKLKRVDALVETKNKTMIAQRSERIARTEAGTFLNTLEFEQFRELQKDDPNRIYKKEWWCTNDSRSRDGHIYLLDKYGNGNGIPLNDYFETQFGKLMYPQDPSGQPEDVIECRCKMILTWE